MANQKILFLRQETPATSRDLAIAALDKVNHKKGQPVVAYYRVDESTRALLAIGKVDGVGKNYEIIANYSDVTDLETKITTKLESYATIGALNTGLAKKVDKEDGKRLMTNAEGTQIQTNKTAITSLQENSATKTALNSEIDRATKAEQANATAIGLKADKSALTDHEASIASASALGHIKATATESATVPGGKNYKVQVTTGGEAFVAVPWTDTKVEIPVKGVNSTDKVLSLGEGELLSTTLGLAYDSDNHLIKLTGKSGAEVATLDASAFIKDGMISTAVYNSAKKTIDLTFNTDGGGQTISVDVSALVNTYLAGNGLILSGNKFSVRVNEAGGYLTFTGETEGQKSLTFNNKKIEDYADNAVAVEKTRATGVETSIKTALGTKGTPSSDTAFGLIDSLSKTLATHKVKDIKGTAQQIAVTSDNSGNYTIAFANDMLVDGGTF